MEIKQFKKVWGTPVLIALITLFGLLAALLGVGYWHFLSWLALSIPIIIIAQKSLSSSRGEN